MDGKSSNDASTMIAIDRITGREYSMPADTPKTAPDRFPDDTQFAAIRKSAQSRNVELDGGTYFVVKGPVVDGFRPPKRRAENWNTQGIEDTIVVADANGSHIAIPWDTPDEDIASRGWTRVETLQSANPGGPVLYDQSRTHVFGVPVMTLGSGQDGE